MPNWKKLITSGSDAALNSLTVDGTVTANVLEAETLVSHAGDANTGLQFSSDTVIIEGNNSNIATFNTSNISFNASYPIDTGVWQATDIGLAHGGTGASLSDPNDDRILFWDDSAGQVTWLDIGSNLTILLRQF